MNLSRRIFLARVISLFLTPLVSVNLGIGWLLWQTLQKGQLFRWQFFCLIFTYLFLPTTFFFWGVKKKQFDLDLTQKRQRFRFYVFSLASGFLGLNLTYYFSPSLFRLFLTLTITGLVFMVVSFWDKASLHVGGLVSVYLVVNLLNDWHYFYFIPLLPLVGWSRIVLKKHSLVEVLEGFLIPWLTIPLGFFLLKIIS